MLQPLKKQHYIDIYNQSHKKPCAATQSFHQPTLRGPFLKKLNALIVSVNQSEASFSVPKTVHALAERYQAQTLLLKERVTLAKAKMAITRMQQFSSSLYRAWSIPAERAQVVTKISSQSQQQRLRNLLEVWHKAGVFSQHSTTALLYLYQHSLPLLIAHFKSALKPMRLRRMPKAVRAAYQAQLEHNLAAAEAYQTQLLWAMCLKLTVLDDSGFRTSQSSWYLGQQMQAAKVSLPQALPAEAIGAWVDMSEAEFLQLQQLIQGSQDPELTAALKRISWHQPVDMGARVASTASVAAEKPRGEPPSADSVSEARRAFSHARITHQITPGESEGRVEAKPQPSLSTAVNQRSTNPRSTSDNPDRARRSRMHSESQLLSRRELRQLYQPNRTVWGLGRRSRLRVAFYQQHAYALAMMRRFVAVTQTVRTIESLTLSDLQYRLAQLDLAVQKIQLTHQAASEAVKDKKPWFWLRKHHRFFHAIGRQTQQGLQALLKQQLDWLGAWRLTQALTGPQLLKADEVDYLNHCFAQLSSQLETYGTEILRQQFDRIKTGVLPMMVESRTLLHLQSLIKGHQLSHQNWGFVQKNLTHYRSHVPSSLRALQQALWPSVAQACQEALWRISGVVGAQRQLTQLSSVTHIERLFDAAQLLSHQGAAFNFPAGLLKKAFLSYIHWVADCNFLETQSVPPALRKIQKMNGVFKFLFARYQSPQFFLGNRPFQRIIHDFIALQMKFGSLAYKQGSQFLMLRLKSQAQGLLAFDKKVSHVKQLVSGAHQLYDNIQTAVVHSFESEMARSAHQHSLGVVFRSMREQNTSDSKVLHTGQDPELAHALTLFQALPNYIQAALKVCVDFLLKKAALDRLTSHTETFDYGHVIASVGAVAHTGFASASQLGQQAEQFRQLFYNPQTRQHLFQGANLQEPSFVHREPEPRQSDGYAGTRLSVLENLGGGITDTQVSRSLA